MALIRLHCIVLLLHKIFSIRYYTSGCANISRFLSPVRRHQSFGKIVTFFVYPRTVRTLCLYVIFTQVYILRFSLCDLYSSLLLRRSDIIILYSRCLFSRIRSMLRGSMIFRGFPDTQVIQPTNGVKALTITISDVVMTHDLIYLSTLVILYGFGLHNCSTFFYFWLVSDLFIKYLCVCVSVYCLSQ